MAFLKVESKGWTEVATRSGEAPGGLDLPDWMLPPEASVGEVVTLQAEPTRGEEPPKQITLSAEPEPGRAQLLVVRHESGAVTFHPPVTDRSGDGRLRFDVPIHWDTEAASRGFFSKIVKAGLVKVRELVVDELTKRAMPFLARQLEERLWSRAGRARGWKLVTPATLGRDELAPTVPVAGSRSLLFIHGTFSHAGGGFGSLAKSDFFDRVRTLYGERIYAFDHFTLSETPAENARALLAALPGGSTTFDVITHSRGGLVLRTLVEDADVKAQADAAGFVLGHAVLVASPNGGTPLARPGRYEDTFGWLANLLEAFPVDNWFTTVAELVSEGVVWLANNVVGNLPGLTAMNADDDVIKGLQGPPAPPAGKYSALVSNYRPDAKLFNRLLDVGIDAFFETANDLVVPSAGGWLVDAQDSGVIAGSRIGCFGSGGNLTTSPVTHTGFFEQPATVNFLVNALTGTAQPLLAIDTTKALPNLQLLRGGPAEMSAAAGLRRTIAPPVEVTVVHGDLLFERDPLLIGHYTASRLTGAERYMDGLLGGTMSNALSLGLYPDAPGTNRIFPTPRLESGDAWRQLVEAVIVTGLGPEGSLKGPALAESIRSAAVAWIQRVCENAALAGREAPKTVNLVSTLIGSGGLGVTPGQSAQLIVQGIRDANDVLADLNARSRGGAPKWPLVGQLRLVELYLDRATEAWHALRMGADQEAGGIRFDSVIDVREGGLPRAIDAGYRGADYDYVRVEVRTDGSGDDWLAYVFDTRRARAEATSQQSQFSLVRQVVSKWAENHSGDIAVSRALFQMLVPPEIEPMLTSTGDIQLEVNQATAGIPWELLDDQRDDTPDARPHEPWAIRTKLLRRLKVEQFRRQVVDADREHSMLVIGEPACPKGYPKLPGARKEAADTADVLAKAFGEKQVVGLFNKDVAKAGPNAEAILSTLFARPWRTIHVSGHGIAAQVRDGKRRHGGLVMSDDLVLGAPTLRAMRVAPELVFMNCCYIGEIGAGEVLSPDLAGLDRPALAANLAEEFIRAGVRCVVAAGWAINDRAAEVFASTFYRVLLGGGAFIDAVDRARRAAYKAAPQSTTWAAYQCYGDPDWRLVAPRWSDSGGVSATPVIGSAADLELRLLTFATSARREGASQAQRRRTQLDGLETAALKHGWARKPAMQMLFADAYKAIRDYDNALRWYRECIDRAAGDAPLKAIEQYSNLLARRAWQQVRAEVERTGSVSQEVLDSARRDFDDADRRIDGLMVLGLTAERASLKASVAKRRALAEAQAGNRTQSGAALKDVRKWSRKALDEMRKGDKTGAFYPCLNVLAAELALKGLAGKRARFDRALIDECKESLRVAAAKSPNIWSYVGGHDLNLMLAAADGTLPAKAGALLDEYALCFKARSGGVEWDSVFDGAEFVLSEHWSPRESAAGLRDVLGRLRELIRG